MTRPIVILALILAAARAYAQDAATRPPMVMRGRSIDLRPDGLWSLPKPEGIPCEYGEPGCCRSDGEPDGGRCTERPPEYAREAAPGLPQTDAPHANLTDTSRTAPRPPAHVPHGWLAVYLWAIGLGTAMVALARRRWRSSRPAPSVALPGHTAEAKQADSPAPEPALIDRIPEPWNALLRVLYRIVSVEWRAEAGRAKHREELVASISTAVNVPVSRVRTEPNDHGSGWRAWIGGPGESWADVRAKSKRLARSMTTGNENTALARLRVSVKSTIVETENA